MHHREDFAHINFSVDFLQDVLILVQLKNSSQFKLHALPPSFVLMCSCIYIGLIVPPVITVINTIKTSVFAYVGTLVTIGLMLSVVCLMFTAIFHNRK